MLSNDYLNKATTPHESIAERQYLAMSSKCDWISTRNTVTHSGFNRYETVHGLNMCGGQ